MIKKNNFITYPRILFGQIIKLVDFSYASSFNSELGKSLKEEITYQSNPLMDMMSIDKVSYKFHRDFLKERRIVDNTLKVRRTKDSWSKYYLGGAVSISIHGEWFWVHFHREYIPLDIPLSEYIEKVFRYLILCTNLFKLPLHKTITSLGSEEVQEEEQGKVQEKDFPKFHSIDTEEEYFHAIYTQRILDCIELCFDFHGFVMNPYLPKEFSFNIKEDTYYLNDYREYKNGSEHRSMLVLYDKRKCLLEKKHRYIPGIWERFEIRLYPYSFSCMKGAKGLELMNNTYEGLFDVLSKPIKSHIKRYGMDFTEFREHLPEGYERLYMLLSVPKK